MKTVLTYDDDIIEPFDGHITTYYVSPMVGMHQDITVGYSWNVPYPWRTMRIEIVAGHEISFVPKSAADHVSLEDHCYRLERVKENKE